MDLIARIDHLFESTMDAVKAAAERRDTAALPGLAQRVQKIEKLKENAQLLATAVSQLEGEASSGTHETNNDHLPPNNGKAPERPSAHPRRLLIHVTQGMINQNLLTLTDHVQAGRVRTGQMLRIEAVPSGERFATDLMSEGNRLRERGAIARFYREARVSAGDTVALTEEMPGDWTLCKWPVSGIPSGVPTISTEDKI